MENSFMNHTNKNNASMISTLGNSRHHSARTRANS